MSPARAPLRRLALLAIVAAMGVARRLPDRPAYALAFALGRALAYAMPARRKLVRANLERVCTWLVAHGRASPGVAAAAADPGRLDALVRSAFGHWVLTYVEAAMAPRYSADDLRHRIRSLHPEAAAAALARPQPGAVGSIALAMHFGSVDLAGLYATRVERRVVTAPMEQVADPLAREVFGRVRAALGVTIVPVSGAADQLAAALREGQIVGLVADRVVAGSGARVELFGAPARLPLGPALLSMQTGAPIWLQAFERQRLGRCWVAHTMAIEAAPGTARRAAIRSILEAEARAFERIVARAPEQWSTLFFPIWAERTGPA